MTLTVGDPPPGCTCGPYWSILPPGPCPVHSAPAPVFTWPPIRAAWECPRCQKVNAPHADQCTCLASRAWTTSSMTVTLAPPIEPQQEILKARCKACGVVTEAPMIGHVCSALSSSRGVCEHGRDIQDYCGECVMPDPEGFGGSDF